VVLLAGKMEWGELGYMCLGGGGWRNVGGETLTISFTMSSGTGIPHSILKAWHSTVLKYCTAFTVTGIQQLCKTS